MCQKSWKYPTVKRIRLGQKISNIGNFCSFLQSPEPPINHKDKEPKRNGTSHRNNNNLGTKFQDVQRKWMLSPPPMGESDSASDLDPDPCNPTRSNSALPLGHSSVKSLSTKFSNSSSPANSEKSSQNGGGQPHSSRPEAAVIEEQKRLIESLRQQVTSKDRRIQQLEDQVRMLSLPLKPTESVVNPVTTQLL